jgi:ABC-type bacteriocin/lantibiotic exporter with double-glycine peptidase domain
MIGSASIVGLLGILIQVFLNVIYAWFYLRMQHTIMESKDARMKIINEIFQGITTIKLNGYYKYFTEKVTIS